MQGKTQEGRAQEGMARDRKVREGAQEVVGAGGATCGDLQCQRQRQRQRHVAAPLLLRAATVVAVAATRDAEIQNQMAKEK